MIEARYRTSGESAVLGESLAGLFITETFLKEPAAFDHYIAVSPSMWWGGQELGQRGVDFECDGEMQVNVALDYELMQSTYPFCRLTGPANVLVMPGLHAANISQKLLTEFADGTVIGPVLQGLNHAVQITSMTAKVSDVLNAAVFAAIESARK